MDVHVLPGLHEVQPEHWDALVGKDNPFIEYAFLRLLEDSQSVGEGTGWIPLHIVVKEGERIVGAAPCYLKGHSYGEYIFDWEWARAATQLGLRYYPKLVVGVPFTPATGPRLLTHPKADAPRVREALLSGLQALMLDVGASSVHVLFCTDQEAEALAAAGWMRRATHQYHWRNDHYADFEAFLAALRSSPRKQIRKERRKLSEAGVEITLHRGDALSDADWAFLAELYFSTCEKKWGQAYLSEAFFQNARATVGRRALVALATREGERLAGTLSFQKGAHLYGRYWGARRELEGLHFELCYYTLIEYAIQHGLSLVEAGAQGEHKIKRGFVPVVTHSAHLVAEPGFAHALQVHLKRERALVEEEVSAWQASTPFRQGAAPAFPLRAGIPLPLDDKA